MFAFVRTVVYASLFIALLLVLLPARLLEWSGVTPPPSVGGAQIVGGGLTLLGGLLALWCVLAFGTVGRGTPAPFDPPRRLVVAGPYRWVRNPMYLGAVVALVGAAVFYGSAALGAYAVVFLGLAHLFVVLWEEPALARTFGADYEAYRRRTGRWAPRRRVG
jgi:protein-S-isoprenylcysteine O-methyltransferase Ste14